MQMEQTKRGLRRQGRYSYQPRATPRVHSPRIQQQANGLPQAMLLANHVGRDERFAPSVLENNFDQRTQGVALGWYEARPSACFA